MNASEIKSAYARELKETIVVRRYTGTGTNRPHFEAAVRGKARLYGASEIQGSITLGDWNVIILVADLIAAKFALPLTKNDFVIVAGRHEMAIMVPGERKAPTGEIVVYDCQARG